MGEPWHDHSVDIFHHGIERFRFGRWVLRQRSANCARFEIGLDSVTVDALAVVSDPVDQSMAVGAKFVGGHS